MTDKEAIDLHKKLKGKIETKSKVKLSKDNLSLIYTPGVAAASSAIAKDRSKLWGYTIKENTIAVITDGSAVLGQGNLGPEAALPVMEGKCVLFKELAGVNAFPISIASQETDEIVRTVRNICSVFGGINLEDIAAPRCFEVEGRLQDLGIPVMHDDQHGTAVVALAALTNSMKVLKKDLKDARISIIGAGAAGLGIANLLSHTGLRNIIVSDSKGMIYKGRQDLNIYKQQIAEKTNPKRQNGTFHESLDNADVVIGVSGVPGMLKDKDIARMNENPVIFALSNPQPEIMPAEARRAGAAIIGTGRSDLPNQINNVLAFPGIFRGALDARAERITDKMKIAAANALAASVKPTATCILPNPLDKEYTMRVANAVKRAA